MNRVRKASVRDETADARPFVCYFNGANRMLNANLPSGCDPRAKASRRERAGKWKTEEVETRARSCWAQRAKKEEVNSYAVERRDQNQHTNGSLCLLEQKNQMRRVIEKIERLSNDAVALQLIEKFSDSLSRSTASVWNERAVTSNDSAASNPPLEFEMPNIESPTTILSPLKEHSREQLSCSSPRQEGGASWLPPIRHLHGKGKPPQIVRPEESLVNFRRRILFTPEKTVDSETKLPFLSSSKKQLTS